MLFIKKTGARNILLNKLNSYHFEKDLNKLLTTDKLLFIS